MPLLRKKTCIKVGSTAFLLSLVNALLLCFTNQNAYLSDLVEDFLGLLLPFPLESSSQFLSYPSFLACTFHQLQCSAWRFSLLPPNKALALVYIGNWVILANTTLSRISDKVQALIQILETSLVVVGNKKKKRIFPVLEHLSIVETDRDSGAEAFSEVPML